MQGSPDALQFVGLLAECAANPDAEVVSKAIGFEQCGGLCPRLRPYPAHL